MNNEPVAWMDKNGDPSTIKNDLYTIPLYTHPVKELTDEEIDECSCFVDVELSKRYGSIESIDDIDWTITGLRAFARAILRKAQEK